MTDVAERLQGVIAPYVATEDVELDDLEVRGGGGTAVIRVTLDAEGGLHVDRIAELSRGISRLLDALDPFPGSYTLEVSTPGLERKLRRPSHFAKSLGREAKVKTTAPIDGAAQHRGVIAAVDDGGFTLEVDGQARRIAYDQVATARTVFTWERAAKPGARR